MKLLYFTFTLIISTSLYAKVDLTKKIVNLKGYWKFEIGDNPDYARVEYDDLHWEEIYVPSSWEDEGFPGYDGYAWYRIEFTISEDYKEKELYLKLGPIDDVDETYLNGKLISYKGSFPPDYFTQAHEERLYHIPRSSIIFGGNNILAIRVFDQSGTGGIVRGEAGIFLSESELNCDYKITGNWKFKTGDNIDWKKEFYDDSMWQEVEIPSKWCYIDLKDYDGFAWYRKKIIIGKEYEDENLILVVGKIDDMDETFINGERIGGTGNLNFQLDKIILDHNAHNILRAYYIPKNVLKFGKENTIAIRVYDGITYGGIVEGPLGITTRDEYRRYKRNEKNSFINFLKQFFN